MSGDGQRCALIAAGGTGGHLFPAQALAMELLARGWRVELATDHRVESYGGDFPAAATHIIPSATPSGGGLLGKVKAGLSLMRGILMARGLIRRIHPRVIVGFGGYPTVPPVYAGTMLRVPTLIHDANAVIGRANRFLAPRVSAIATSLPDVKLPPGTANKVTLTGNPVRPAVLEASRVAYPEPAADGPFHLLVFGGSQGARIFSDVVPAALALLDPGLRARLKLTQQARPEDLDKAKAALQAAGVAADIAPFFKDLPARIAGSHLVVCRSGASTVAEMGVIGRPALYVPLPGAIDQDQRANAAAMAALGGGWLVDQSALTAEKLAAELTRLMGAPAELAAAAAAAKSFGRPEAARNLADLVDNVAG